MTSRKFSKGDVVRLTAEGAALFDRPSSLESRKTGRVTGYGRGGGRGNNNTTTVIWAGLSYKSRETLADDFLELATTDTQAETRAGEASSQVRNDTSADDAERL
jgi:hypothetical protein